MPVLALLAACASTPTGGGLRIETISKGAPVEGAHCVLGNGGSTWSFDTPATLAIHDVKGDLQVACQKEGYRASQLIIKNGGLGGANVGVGLAGGSGGRTSGGIGIQLPFLAGYGGYPNRIVVEMTPESVSERTPAQ